MLDVGSEQVDEIERRLEDARRQLDPDEFGRLLMLPQDVRAVALLRFERITSWLASPRGRGGDLPRFAEGTGVGPDRFYTLARTYDRTRSVAALGVAAPKAANGRFVTRRSSRIESERVRIEDAMRRVLVRSPDASTEDMLKAARRVPVDRPPGKSTLYKWAAAMRSAAGSHVFGSPLLAIVAVDAVLDEATVHDVAIVLDRGTSLVMGAAVATGRSAFEAYRLAALEGSAKIESLTLPVPCITGGIRLDAASYADPATSPMEVLRFVAEYEPHWRPVDPEEASATIMDRLGPVLGSIRLEDRPPPWRMEAETARPARVSHAAVDGAQPDCDDERPEHVGVSEMEARIAAAVDEHNRGIIVRLGRGREPARTRRARLRMSQVLATMRGEEA